MKIKQATCKIRYFLIILSSVACIVLSIRSAFLLKELPPVCDVSHIETPKILSNDIANPLARAVNNAFFMGEKGCFGKFIEKKEGWTVATYKVLAQHSLRAYGNTLMIFEGMLFVMIVFMSIYLIKFYRDILPRQRNGAI